MWPAYRCEAAQLSCVLVLMMKVLMMKVLMMKVLMMMVQGDQDVPTFLHGQSPVVKIWQRQK